METPPNSVKLVTVSKWSPGFLKFTFENVSGKSIVEILVGTPHGPATGADGFTGGPSSGFIAPGATVSAVIGSQGFSAGGQITKEIVVDAIFYDDGSGFGPYKAHIEDDMLGTALETKRDAALLAASPDPSISGFDKVEAQIRSKPLHTNAEAIQSLRGITLPGISQKLINERLAHSKFFVRAGADSARQQTLLVEIGGIKSNDARAMARSVVGEPEKRSHALSDLAKKYSSLSEWQVQYLKKVFKEGDE